MNNSIKNAIKLKSKTINFNALYMAIVASLPVFGVNVTPEQVAAGQTILNVILRFLTDTPIGDKI